MPWIIEDTFEPSGEGFLRKLPAGRSKFTILDEATVFRTKELAEKEASKYAEFFLEATGERVSREEWWNATLRGAQTKYGHRPPTTLVLHKVDLTFLRSVPYTKK